MLVMQAHKVIQEIQDQMASVVRVVLVVLLEIQEQSAIVVNQDQMVLVVLVEQED